MEGREGERWEGEEREGEGKWYPTFWEIVTPLTTNLLLLSTDAKTNSSQQLNVMPFAPTLYCSKT